MANLLLVLVQFIGKFTFSGGYQWETRIGFHKPGITLKFQAFLMMMDGIFIN